MQGITACNLHTATKRWLCERAEIYHVLLAVYKVVLVLVLVFIVLLADGWA